MQCDMTDIVLSFSITFLLLIYIISTYNSIQCIIFKQNKQPLKDIHVKTNTNACNASLLWVVSVFGHGYKQVCTSLGAILN